MSNIVKASNLSLPSISGFVKVPLAELDKMRAEHVAAVKLAQDLEDKQAQVRITIVTGERYVHSYDKYGSPRYDTKERQDVSYKNMDEVVESIKKEADERWGLKLQQEIGKNTKLSEDLASCKETSSILNKELDHIKDAFGKLKESEEQLTATVESLNSMVAYLSGEKQSLTNRLNDERVKKSFWFWLRNLLDTNRNINRV